MINTVAGLPVVADRRCSKCGGPVFLKPAPCFMRKTKAGGWATCTKCVRCGFTEGYQKRRRP